MQITMKGNLLALLEGPLVPLVPETLKLQVDPMKNSNDIIRKWYLSGYWYNISWSLLLFRHHFYLQAVQVGQETLFHLLAHQGLKDQPLHLDLPIIRMEK